MHPLRRHRHAAKATRFLRLDHEAVDREAATLTRQIGQLRQRLEALLGSAGPGHGDEAAQLRALIASRRAHLLNLERMRQRASGG